MDPAALLSVLSILEKIQQFVGDAALTQMQRHSLRWRVAWRSWREARRHHIDVTLLGIAGWLTREDTKSQLCSGPDVVVESAIRNLEFRVAAAGDESTDSAALRLLAIILNEYLRALSPDDAMADAVRWLRGQTLAQHRATRDHVTSETTRTINALSEEVLDRILLTIHPWRAEFARELSKTWPNMRELLQQLCSARDRSQTLNEWSRSPTQLLDSAPPSALAWLGDMAGDHGENRSALRFIERAIEAGIADPNYWWARSGLLVDQQTMPEEARQLLERSQPPHPLALAQLAFLSGEYSQARMLAAGWSPNDASDRAIQTLLMSASFAREDNFVLAVEQLRTAITDLPEATGLKIRLAEMLVTRGYLGPSDHPIGDYLTARKLAIEARDDRRKYRLDSVSAILVAIKAAVLSNDVEDAWRLTQPEPSGRCNADEAANPRIRREATILCALRGDALRARQMAASLNDASVTAWVDGWVAHLEEDDEEAINKWMVAWELASQAPELLLIARAIISVGGTLPDLSLLQADYPEQVGQLRALQEVMAAPSDQLTLLRSRAGESAELTVALADRLRGDGNHEEAAEVLFAAAGRWRNPLLMRMAASCFLDAGVAERAVSAARAAVGLGGPSWPGRLASLAVLFSAQEAMGLADEAKITAQEMVASDPDSADARWALIQCLLRAGDVEGAWTALNYRGNPIRPRSAAEARHWVFLVTRFDPSPHLVSRALEVVREWSEDSDLTGTFLMMIYEGLRRLDAPAPQDQVAELHVLTAEYIDKNPFSRTFRKLEVEEGEDILESLVTQLRQNEQSPEIDELLQRVHKGELPAGFASTVLNRSYLEVLILGSAPVRFMHSIHLTESAGLAMNQSRGKPVVVDTSAIATLVLLDAGVIEALLGEFLLLRSTDVAYRDALDGQQMFGMRSTVSIRLDNSREKLIVDEIGQHEADELAEHANRVVALYSRVDRRGWPQMQYFKELDYEVSWLNALDFALSHRTAFWCDDIALRGMATSQEVPTFDTVDLLRNLHDRGGISDEELLISEARLVSKYYVDLGFDDEVMHLAAEFDGWNVLGAASNLARVQAWGNPEATVAFGIEAMKWNASAHPERVRGWIYKTTVGLLAIVPDDPDGAASNVQILLRQLMIQPWMASHLLPFVLTGMRAALEERPGVTDPLESVLRTVHGELCDRHGHTWAASSLLLLVEHLGPQDRALAARIVLTHDL